MLQIQALRNDRDAVIAGLKKKQFRNTGLVDMILQLDQEKRHLQQESETIAAQLNASSRNIGQLMASGKQEEAQALKTEINTLKDTGKSLSAQLAEAEGRLQDYLLQLPNLPHASVPEGAGAEDNAVIKAPERLPELPDDALPHWELARKYKLIDFETGTKITGSGFPLYIGSGAKLQRALVSYFLDYNIRAGYTEYCPPLLVNEASAFGTGQLPDKEGQMYHATEDQFYLIPTSEVPLTNIFREEIIAESALPLKLTAYTPCFRREAGSYGKDVRGLNRLHQFDKVEVVQLCRPDLSYQVLEEMVAHVEGLLASLGLPYRILKLCGGDMSFTSALTYDFEVYSAAQQRWLEVSSVSNFETFQTHRMKIRFKDAQNKSQLLHSLNGSALALPRIVACLLENHQQADGIHLPEVLVNYMGTPIVQ